MKRTIACLLIIFSSLLVQGKQPEEISPVTELSKEAYYGRIPELQQLITDGADINEQDNRGFTALMWASLGRNAQAVEKLLAEGADVTLELTDAMDTFWGDQRGATALSLASGGCNGCVTNNNLQTIDDNLRILRMLLDAGADINARTVFGRTPLMAAAQGRQSSDLTVPFGGSEGVTLLLDAGADVHGIDDEGFSAFIIAARRGHLQVVKKLIEAGAVIDNRTNEGRTAFMYAAWSGSLDTVKYLLEKGADIHERDSDGLTPLMLASYYDNPDTVEFLIQKGAKVNDRSGTGTTALMIAAHPGNIGVIQVLSRRGGRECLGR